MSRQQHTYRPFTVSDYPRLSATGEAVQRAILAIKAGKTDEALEHLKTALDTPGAWIES